MRSTERAVSMSEGFLYALAAPTVLVGAQRRYACCRGEVGGGHTSSCSSDAQCEAIRRALQESSIERFVFVDKTDIDRVSGSKASAGTSSFDPVERAEHYNLHPAGIECIDVIEHMPANLALAMKYLWRVGLKQGVDTDEDLRKAIWYVKRERKRLGWTTS